MNKIEEAERLFLTGMYVRDIAKLVDIYPVRLGKILKSMGHSPKKNASSKHKHPNWKGGRILNAYGYIRVRNSEHPRSTQGYVLEHILVAEKKLGRFLKYYGQGNKDNETVHHINGIKTDNRPENLEILGNREHLLEEWSTRPHNWPQSKESQIKTPERYLDWLTKNKLRDTIDRGRQSSLSLASSSGL